MNKKIKSAFSLVELAVVIVVVGIMIAGIMQSSRLINNMRLNVARDLTQSSAMPWINYIVTWYDATAGDAFNEKETNDGDLISRWNGAEVRYQDRINLLQDNDTKKPKFIIHGMNGLPSIKFDGVNDILESEFSNQDVLTYRSASLFAVFEVKNVNTTKGTLFFNKGDCERQLDLAMNINNSSGSVGIASGYNAETACSTSYATYSNSNFVKPFERVVIAVVINQGPIASDSTSNVKIYRNGNLETSNSINSGGANNFNSSAMVNEQRYAYGNNKFYIGAKNGGVSDFSFFDGMIGEMIIFNRSLNNEDRNEIERYLGKKWGIKIKNYE